MDEKKPKNFEEAALSHIPKEILHSMTQETSVAGLDGMSPLEAIMKAKGVNIPGPSAPEQKTQPQQQKQSAQLAVDGFVLNVSSDKFEAGVTMLTYIFARMANKDKKIAKILDQFRFSMYDVNGEPIYVAKSRKK